MCAREWFSTTVTMPQIRKASSSLTSTCLVNPLLEYSCENSSSDAGKNQNSSVVLWSMGSRLNSTSIAMQAINDTTATTRQENTPPSRIGSSG